MDEYKEDPCSISEDLNHNIVTKFKNNIGRELTDLTKIFGTVTNKIMAESSPNRSFDFRSWLKIAVSLYLLKSI